MSQRIINVKQLNDGTEQACIHYLVEGSGPIAFDSLPSLRGTLPPKVNGYIACNPEQNTIFPQMRNGETLVCVHSNEVRAVTCPKCLATEEAKAMLAKAIASEDAVPVMSARDVAAYNETIKTMVEKVVAGV